MTSLPTIDGTRSSLIKRVMAAVLTSALFAVIVIGLASSPPTEEDRVAELGSRLRCPVCQNEAIADSPSETARRMMAIVGEKVDQGESDETIEAFFVARYGEWILLDPPLGRRFLLLWSLPVIGLVVGIVAIARRRRRATSEVDPMIAADTEEIRKHAERDLAELSVQLEEHEITAEVAADLAAKYTAERERAKAQHRPSRDDDDDEKRSRSRVLTGWALAVLAMGVVTVMVVQAVEVRGENADALIESGQRPLSEVTNEELEAVVAEDPDITPMRLALADRYFKAAEYESALEHYLEVLKQDPSQGAAWARLGWTVYQLGETDLALEYVRRSLEVEPGRPESELYLGTIYLYGYGDAEAALPLLQGIAARDDVPPDIRASVDQAIAVARSEMDE
jgi:cytochrome c-type biogenesis protein CcmH